MRLVWLFLGVVLDWPIGAWQRFRARRRLHTHHGRLASLTLERIA